MNGSAAAAAVKNGIVTTTDKPPTEDEGECQCSNEAYRSTVLNALYSQTTMYGHDIGLYCLYDREVHTLAISPGFNSWWVLNGLSFIWSQSFQIRTIVDGILCCALHSVLWLKHTR